MFASFSETLVIAFVSVVAVLMAETRSPAAVLMASASVKDPPLSGKALMELSSESTWTWSIRCQKAEAESTDLSGDFCDVCFKGRNVAPEVDRAG